MIPEVVRLNSDALHMLAIAALCTSPIDQWPEAGLQVALVWRKQMSISGPGSLSGDIKNYSDSAEVNLPFTACSLAVCIHTHETLIVAPEVDSSYMSVLDPEGVVRLLYTVNRETCVYRTAGLAFLMHTG